MAIPTLINLEIGKLIVKEGFTINNVDVNPTACGTINYRNKTVAIKKSLPPQERLEVLVHEFWHLLQFRYRYDWMFLDGNDSENMEKIIGVFNLDASHEEKVIKGIEYFDSVKNHYKEDRHSWERMAYIAQYFPERVLEIYKELGG